MNRLVAMLLLSIACAPAPVVLGVRPAQCPPRSAELRAEWDRLVALEEAGAVTIESLAAWLGELSNVCDANAKVLEQIEEAER